MSKEAEEWVRQNKNLHKWDTGKMLELYHKHAALEMLKAETDEKLREWHTANIPDRTFVIDRTDLTESHRGSYTHGSAMLRDKLIKRIEGSFAE